ncbi:DUF6346 domain-containing protein [Prauserella oleivorans]|uniref:DUF6346 domain-containing protein n=1 Tax=Prauserella oleivorans TaxID=1478153 RepID=UPI00363E76B3
MGTAVVRSCDPGGPLSPLGVSWYHDCDLSLRWSDGESGEASLTTTELGGDDMGSTVGVVERAGGDKWGRGQAYPALDTPNRYGPLAAVLFVAFGVVWLFFPHWYRLGTPAERAERRARARFKARPALVVAGGYWLLIAGGAGWPVSPPQPGLPGWGPLT